MNNAINEIKNTLEATKSRITEAEDRISELDGRLWQFAHPRPLSLLQRGLAPRSKGKARAELRPARRAVAFGSCPGGGQA